MQNARKCEVYCHQFPFLISYYWPHYKGVDVHNAPSLLPNLFLASVNKAHQAVLFYTIGHADFKNQVARSLESKVLEWCSSGLNNKFFIGPQA